MNRGERRGRLQQLENLVTIFLCVDQWNDDDDADDDGGGDDDGKCVDEWMSV